ncbi:MAG: hypothetical protein KME47_09985 [Nodosilinea sp. WJT8-NPBG4]|jgi:hypothetical protein|nr:hypothetical protein [Nodosilinea sp. WJT8-NPBG4]
MDDVIFSAYGVFHGTLSKSPDIENKYNLHTYPEGSTIEQGWRYSVRKKLNYKIKQKVDVAPLEGFWCVYPHFKVKTKQFPDGGSKKIFDLGFQIVKYYTENKLDLKHGEFVGQGALMGIKADRFKLGIGPNESSWRGFKPYQVLVGGEIDGYQGELWKCILSLDKYRFNLERGVMLEESSPTIRFN